MRKEWLEWYVWNKIRMRVIIERERNKITDFVVQLEINDNGWKEAVRYNFAHGKPHRDLIHKDGKKEKVWLGDKELAEILTYAEIDIKTNWKRYLKECGWLEIE
ncbi:MAG: hypothetical protein QME47_07520 [Candidatus Thermoplasmatota archaeon]|nr:hypothetical protein [Candidatus Thermoplasmatota archaeon]